MNKKIIHYLSIWYTVYRIPLIFLRARERIQLRFFRKTGGDDWSCDSEFISCCYPNPRLVITLLRILVFSFPSRVFCP